MPSPYVGIKPYAPERAHGAATFGCGDASALDDRRVRAGARPRARPRSDRRSPRARARATRARRAARAVARRCSRRTRRGRRSSPHAANEGKLDARSARRDRAARAVAHAGRQGQRSVDAVRREPRRCRRARCGAASTRRRWQRILDRARGSRGDWRIFAAAGELADAAAQAPAARGRAVAKLHALVTFEPFGHLPAPIRTRTSAASCCSCRRRRASCSSSIRAIASSRAQLPHAMQIPLLHLFPRVEASCAIRIPQSGWLDESDARPTDRRSHPHGPHGHKIVTRVVRTHRWQRVARDADIHGDGAFTDKVSTALFATDPVAIDLYDKPLARNSQVWNEHYELVLDGPRASQEQIRHAAARRRRGRPVRLSHVLPADARGRARAVLARAGRRSVGARAVARRAARLRHRRARRRAAAGVVAAPARSGPRTSPRRGCSSAIRATCATRRVRTCASCSRRRSCSADRSRRRTRARCCTSRSRRRSTSGWASSRRTPPMRARGDEARRRRCAAASAKEAAPPHAPHRDRSRSARARSRSRSGVDRAPRARRVHPEEQRRRHHRQPRQERRQGGEGRARPHPRSPRSRRARRSPARALSRADRGGRHDRARPRSSITCSAGRPTSTFPWMEGWATNHRQAGRAQHRDDDPRQATATRRS